MAGNDGGGLRVTALEHEVAGVKAKPALGQPVGVARNAAGLEDGDNVAGEVDWTLNDIFFRGERGVGSRCQVPADADPSEGQKANDAPATCICCHAHASRFNKKEIPFLRIYAVRAKVFRRDSMARR